MTYYNVTLGSVTYLRAAMMLLMMLLTTATAWAEDVPAVYALTFDGNGGTCGDGQMNDQTFTYDESQNLTAHYNTNNFTLGDLSYQWTSGIDVKVTACNSSATSVTIPATVTNEDVTYSVNAIDATAFSSCVSLNTVFLYSFNPPTLGSNVFDGCTALDAIYVPAGTEETYKAADGWKAYADKILAIDTGTYGADVYYSYDSSTKTLRIFGTGAMEDHNIPWDNYRADITKVVISDGVTSIGEQAFFGCSSLTSVNIPASVTTIGMYAFYG